MFPPERFDDYQVLGPLGAGGMGTVFLGRDHMLDRRVALKFIAANTPDARARERFLQEARAIARLHHPNVVGVYRIGTVEGHPYIAYELVDGVPLNLLPWPLPWRRVLGLGLGVARGLAAVHAAGVVHRDVKPANIVAAAGDLAKLIDFGLASRLDDPRGAALSPAAFSDAETVPMLSTAGHLAGTPAYMAPELWTGAAPSPASDVFALGLVMWQLLAGELPFDGLDDDAMVVSIRSRAVPSIATRRADLPRPLAELVDECLARDPAARPFSTALRDRLETIHALYAPLVDGAGGGEPEQRAADQLAESFARATENPDRFSSRFYELAFTLEPGLRPLFPADLSALRVKLVSTLQTVVRNARTPELLVPMLEDLGERHFGYGVVPSNFEVMGRALLGTLAEVDRAQWSPATELLWTRAFQNIARHMTRGLARAARGSLPAAAPPLTRVRVDPPEPRFATSGGVTLAYQVFGEGPRDLLVIPSWFGHMEMAWQEPSFAAFLSQLARQSRVILLDRRGIGLSDRAPASLGLGDQVGDALAVADAAGAERPVVLGLSDGTLIASCLAAAHPERVRGLVLYGGSPCHARRADHPAGLPREQTELICEALRTRWGEPLFAEDLAPSLAEDPAFRARWARQLRAGLSPTMAAAMVRAVAALDARALLPAVRAPTLVMYRKGDRPDVHAGARAYATGIGGARLVELDGADHAVFAGDAAPVLAQLEAFLRDTPTIVTDTTAVQVVCALAVRTGAADAAALAVLRGAVERAGGVAVIDTDGIFAATFDLPDPAARAAAHVPATARAAIRTAGLLGRDELVPPG